MDEYNRRLELWNHICETIYETGKECLMEYADPIQLLLDLTEATADHMSKKPPTLDLQFEEEPKPEE